MRGRNPVRYLAPIAIAATLTATYVIVHGALTSKPAVPTQTRTVQSGDAKPRKFAKSRFYVVKPGDSLSTISSKTGVPIATLEALNPNIDPNALQPSQRLRLRQ